METRELEIFLAVAEHLHFGRASQVCHLSPSALTRTIQRLEEELERPLFLRDRSQVSLSPAGEELRRYARQALQQWQQLRAKLHDEGALAGTLSIYASITAVYSLLPDLLEAYRAAYPEVQLALRTGAAEQAMLQLQSGEIDLVVAAFPDRQSSSLAFLPITTTPLLFIAPRGGESLVAWRDGRIDLARTPLVLPQDGLSRRRLDQWLRRERIVPTVTTEVSGNEAIIPMVRLGCGVGIVPELVLERSPFRDEVEVLHEAPSLDPYEVGLCTSQRSLQLPHVLAFWCLAEKQREGGTR